MDQSYFKKLFKKDIRGKALEEGDLVIVWMVYVKLT